MKTFLYNLNTNQREGPIRNGRYLIDGLPGPLPDFLVELELQEIPDPEFNRQTQYLVYREYIDLPNKKWIKDSFVKDFTPEEIENNNKRLSPEYVTARQFRLGLVKNGITLERIDNLINSIADETKKAMIKIEWEYGTQVYRHHPSIEEFRVLLNLTNEEVDKIFIDGEDFK